MEINKTKLNHDSQQADNAMLDQQYGSFKYAIIMPAYNEEAFIENTIESIMQQIIKPVECIIVDDNSHDRTFKIAQQCANEHSWLKVIQHKKALSTHQPGSKVIHAFYYGLNSLKSFDELDVIVKLDADLTLHPNYFQHVLGLFNNNQDAGIAGGVCYIRKGDTWVEESISDDDHLRGAIKAYRKKCFIDIDGLKPIIGWDVLDELLARYHGWKVLVDKSLIVKHHRTTGAVAKWKNHLVGGRDLYKIGYNFLISTITAAKRSTNRKPYILSGILLWLGFLSAPMVGAKRITNKEERKFIIKYRIDKMKSKVKKRFGSKNN